MVATIYWLPSLTEVQYTNLDNSISAAYDIRNNFKPLDEILGMTPMLDRTSYTPFRPLNIGLVQWVAAALGMVVLGLRWRRFDTWQRGHGLAGSVALLGCIYLMIEPSTWLWENLPLAERLSFPWRLLGIAAVFVLPGIALLVDSLVGKWRQFAAISLIALVIASMLPAAYPIGDEFPPFDGRVTAADAQRYETIGALGITGENEYLPKWTDYENFPATAPDYDRYENLDWYFTYWQPSVPDTVTIEQQPQADYRTGEAFTITTPEPFALQIRQMYFPGWQATLNGDPIEPYPQGAQGLLTLDIPAGSHTLEVWYGGTRNQHISTWVTLIGLLICAGLYGWQVARREKRAHLPAINTRFTWGVAMLALGWLLFNQGIVIPQTEWFRPRSLLTQPMSMEQPLHIRFVEPGIGYRLELMGYTLHEVDDESVEVSLYWRALEPIGGQPRLNLSLTSRDQQQVYGSVSTFHLGAVAASRWPLDQYIEQRVTVPVEAEQSAIGVLRLGVFDDDTRWVNDRDQTDIILTEIPIERGGWDETSGRSVAVRFGSITLHAIEQRQTDEVLYLTLYWEATANIDRDNVLFLHFQDDGATISQADQPPLGINYPTSAWRGGDKLISRLELLVPADADSLLLGLYDAETIIRVPLTTSEPKRDEGLVLPLD
jgi:hypothetical protein